MTAIRFFIQPFFLLGRLYWFLFRPKTYGVKCVIEHEGRYLYVRNTYGSGKWTFPGGGVKRGENTKDAIVREVYEEVGISLTDLRHIGKFEHTNDYKRDTVDVFYAEVKTEECERNKWEISEVRWFDKMETPEDVSAVVPKILDLCEL